MSEIPTSDLFLLLEDSFNSQYYVSSLYSEWTFVHVRGICPTISQ